MRRAGWVRRVGLPVIGVAGLVCPVVTGCAVTVAGSAVSDRVTGTGPAAGSRPAGLPGMLLSLGEMSALLRFSGLATGETWLQPDGRGAFKPAACVGAVFSSMAASYQGSGYRDFYELRLEDPSPGGRQHWVDEGVARFDNPAAARAFVEKQVADWRRCAGQRFDYSYPDPDEWQEPYRIGRPVDAGCATTISNVIDGDDRGYDDIRLLASTADIVVDLQFTGFDVTDQPITVLNMILQRIPGSGRDCTFWG